MFVFLSFFLLGVGVGGVLKALNRLCKIMKECLKESLMKNSINVCLSN